MSHSRECRSRLCRSRLCRSSLCRSRLCRSRSRWCTHNLRPCTGFLFPVNSCIYYGLYTVLFFTYKWTLHFQWSFLCTGILQSIYRIFPVDGLRISGSFKSCILPEFQSIYRKKCTAFYTQKYMKLIRPSG